MQTDKNYRGLNYSSFACIKQQSFQTVHTNFRKRISTLEKHLLEVA